MSTTKVLKYNDSEDINALVDTFHQMTFEEAKAGLDLARQFGLEVEYLIKVSDIAQLWQRELGEVSCFIWPQAAFELGLDYATGKALELKDVKARLESSRAMLKRKSTFNKKYWRLERELCKQMIANWKAKRKPVLAKLR
jgi:hypothetical protein